MKRSPAIYALLLTGQTVCAIVILWHIQSVFRTLIDSYGELREISINDIAPLLSATIIGQGCFWIRVTWIELPPGRGSLVIGHILNFAGKLGFVFGGALFSLFFLRHLPAIEADVSGFRLAWRAMAVLLVLFALYCYTLELERLGNALQAPRPADPGATAVPAGEPNGSRAGPA